MEAEPDMDLSEDPGKHETRAKRELRKKLIGRMVKRRLILVIAILASLTGVVKFGVGGQFWPPWLIQYQGTFTGLLSLGTVVLILASPVIIEFSRDPRPLSGSEVKNYLH